MNEENVKCKIIDIDNINNDMNNDPFFLQDYYKHYYITDDYSVALEIDYLTNYNVKSICQILDFYNINRYKLKKDEMVKLLVLFEEDLNNKSIVEKRKRFWHNIKELKNDKYFNKFILVNI
jgi:hypothetical protein